MHSALGIYVVSVLVKQKPGHEWAFESPQPITEAELHLNHDQEHFFHVCVQLKLPDGSFQVFVGPL